MMATIRIVPILTLAIVCAGCQSTRETGVTHLVVCWLKSPGDESARQRVIDESRSLKAIPGVIHVSAGRVLPSTRPIVDSTFDVAIVMKFRDERALEDYAQHPIHLGAVERTLKPLVARYVVYDYVE
jgi:hypothetical protein